MKTGIITIDFVDSTLIPPAEKQKLYDAAERLLSQINAVYTMQYEWYRGDSLQVKASAQDAARIAIMIKTAIRGIEKAKPVKGSKLYDVRMAVGIGDIDFVQDTLAQSDGEAFHLSGRMLDQLKGMKQSFAIVSNDSHKEALAIESEMLDVLLAGTTAMQCKVLYHKLLGLKEEDIAREIKRSQSAVNQHSNAANWNVIASYINYFEALYHE